MIQCKIFYSLQGLYKEFDGDRLCLTNYSIEDKINDWFKTLKSYNNIVSVTQSSYENGTMTTILYSEQN